MANPKVLTVERMTMLAMRLHRSSATIVLRLSDGLEMIGVHAPPIPAQVVDRQPFGNGTNRLHVGATVGEHRAAPTVGH